MVLRCLIIKHGVNEYTHKARIYNNNNNKCQVHSYINMTYAGIGYNLYCIIQINKRLQKYIL